MIPMTFYRDDEYVYYNNPNGITKKMTIAEFEAMMSGDSELPAYSSSNSGEVLSVDSDGDLEWKTLTLPSDGILVVKMLYNAEADRTHLDKTYDEICEAISDGKLVITCEGEKDDETDVYSYAYTGLICNAGIDGDTEDKFVEILTYVYGVIILDRYIESNGILILHSDYQTEIPPALYQAFTYSGNNLYASGKDVYYALASKYCYFINGSAGTNNEQRFTATDYGKTGTTYYVVLSNGDRYEGGATGNMTKVVNQ